MKSWITVSCVLLFALSLSLIETKALHKSISLYEAPASGGYEEALRDPEPVDGWVFPISGDDYRQITSLFGWRVHPILKIDRRHYGLDIKGLPQSQVEAARNGVVEHHWHPPGTPRPGGGFYRGHDIYGGYIVIRHDEYTISEYGHMSQTRIREGQFVTAGTVLGRTGSTGISTGDHLHFSILIDGEYVNPLLYLPEIEPRS